MRKILIVEDSPDNLDILTDFLDAEGYAVVGATNCEDALASARTDPPHLILMDLHLPAGRASARPVADAGLVTTRALKDNAATRAIPVLALTGDDINTVRAQAIAAGCIAVCAKPYDFAELRETIARCIAPTA